MIFNFEPSDCMEKDLPLWHRALSFSGGNEQKRFGFSLIEMIGVMTVLAILALALAPILVRQMDRLAGESETKQLKAFAEGFRQHILKTKTIQTDWTNVIAAEVGLSTDQILMNERRVERRFLIDPDFRIYPHNASPGPPPYGQNRFGSTNQPANPRVMILSSISRPLPTSIVSGLAASTGPYSFTNIWDTAEETLPLGWTWIGRGDDLKIQRIHLADLFVELTINQEDITNANWGPYSIEGDVGGSLRQVFSAYFIDGSLLGLYNQTNATPQYTEIIHRSKSFTYARGTWRQGGDFFSRAIDRPTALDLQLAAEAFLIAAQNPWADGYPAPSSPAATRTNVYNTMIAYMDEYIAWRIANPTQVSAPNNGPLDQAQVNLNKSTAALSDARP